MKVSRIEPMQTHEPDEQKEEALAVSDIEQKLKSVTAVSENKAETEDVLSEETKGGLKRLADFISAQNKKKNQQKKPQKAPTHHLKVIKAYQALDNFELSQTQKSINLNKAA